MDNKTSALWPAGCSVIFEQHYDARGEHVGQVMQSFPEARDFEMGYGQTMNIRAADKSVLAIVNFDKVLIILPIFTVGPGAV